MSVEKREEEEGMTVDVGCHTQTQQTAKLWTMSHRTQSGDLRMYLFHVPEGVESGNLRKRPARMKGNVEAIMIREVEACLYVVDPMTEHQHCMSPCSILTTPTFLSKNIMVFT